MNTVIDTMKYLYWFGNPPNHHADTAPQPDLLIRLGQGAMAFGGTLVGYGAYILRMNSGVSHPREIRPKESTFVFDCRAENGDRYYDCRTNYKKIPDRMKVDYNGNSHAICDKLTPPYKLDQGVAAYYCEGLYFPSPFSLIELVGPGLMVVGTGFAIAGFYCHKKGKSLEEERQIALTVNPINSFITEHFEELSSNVGMKMDATNVYVCLSEARDCLTFENFKDQGKDQVEWCLIKKGVSTKKTEYYLLQASSAKQISKQNPYTNLPLKPDDILRGQEVLNVFQSKK